MGYIHLPFEITVIKHSFFLSTLIQKEPVAKAMPYFSILCKEKNHHFILQ